MQLNLAEFLRKVRANPILLFCLISSLLGISLIYTAALNIKPSQIKLSEINFELVGRVVSTEGKIVNKRLHKAGHLFLTLEDESSRIQVPIFANLMNRLNEVGLSPRDFTIGKRIFVTGLVSEYKGQLQIVPRKVEDIKIK